MGPRLLSASLGVGVVEHQAFDVIGGARLEFDQRVRRGDELLVSARVKAACVHPGTYKPVPLPAGFREKAQQ